MDFSNVQKLIDTMPQRGIPFLELAVTKDGVEVFRHGVGYSDSTQTKPFEKDDLYWLFSTTKVITCTCAMRLIDEGIIKLSDPVSKYIPSFKDLLVRQEDGSVAKCKTESTIEHLFTMTSGIGHGHEHSPIIKEAINMPNANTLSIVSTLPKIPLYFEPGTRYQYGLSHNVLICVVEIAGKMRFKDYVQKYILDPWG